MFVFKAKEASLTIKVANLLKQNGELFEVGKKDKKEIKALKKKLGKVQKLLDDARLMLTNLYNLHRKMDKLKGKIEGQEAQVHELIAKVIEAKEINMAKFQKSNIYKLAHNTVTAQFLAK